MKKILIPFLLLSLNILNAQNYAKFYLYADINFENGTTSDSQGNATLALQNGATIVSDTERGSKVVQFKAESKGNLKFINSPLKDSMTISFWYKREALDPSECWRMIFAFYADDGSNVFFTPKTTWGDLSYLIFDNKPFAMYKTVAGEAVVNNIWTHYAVVFTYNSMKLYQNGVFISSTPMLIKLSDLKTTKWFLGCNPDLNYPMTGKMDDIKIFHSVLSNNQIKAIFENKTVPNPIDDVKPYIHLPLNVDCNDIEENIKTTSTNITLVSDLEREKVAEISANGRISFDSNPLGTNKFSIAFLLKKESFSLADSGKYIFKMKAANGDFMGLQINYFVNTIQLQAVTNINGILNVIPSSNGRVLIPNVWNSIVFVQTYSTSGTPVMRLYINGVSAFAKLGIDLQSFNSNSWYLGSDGSDNLNAKVDEFEIFLRELSTVDLSNYNNSQLNTVEIKADITTKNQIIRNFGSSDGWNSQAVGLFFNDTQKEKLASLLFSAEKDSDGNPKGIGLSAWRFNIGAGTYEQGSASRISASEKRTECFLNADGTYNWSKQAGQQWFLNKAAKTYNVPDIIGWQNSPPVQYTVRGLGFREFGDPKKTILKVEHFNNFGKFLSDVVLHFKQEGVNIKYISPLNEPQWDWMAPAIGSNTGQEGTPWTNQEISDVVKAIGTEFSNRNVDAKIFVTEAGGINSLLSGTGISDNQLLNLWNNTSSMFIQNVNSLSNIVSSHSYWSDVSAGSLVTTRQSLKERMASVNPNLEYWQTEYCLLGSGYQFGHAAGRTLTPMECAISFARVMHSDLAIANATGWQWWTTFEFDKNLNSEERFGLIRVALNSTNTEGIYKPTKLFYTLGNFSHFIRPGMKRLSITRSDKMSDIDATTNLMVTSYLNEDPNEVVFVVINPTGSDKGIKLSVEKMLPNSYISQFTPYVTSESEIDNLKKYRSFSTTERFIMPANSVVTFVGKINQNTAVPAIGNSANELSIFPNPATDILQIKLTNSTIDNQIRITDLTGKQVLNKNHIQSEFPVTLDISFLGKGLYFITVINSLGNQTKKLIVK